MAGISSVQDDIAKPEQVAEALDTSLAGLAQMRYRGTGPKFVKRGRRVLYRWSDVRDYLDANTCQRTDDVRDVPDRRTIVESRLAAFDGGGDNAA
jgi:hypothetical protein